MPDLRLIPFLILLAAPLPLRAGEKVAVLQTGHQAGHYLAWRNKPVLLIGDSVTQGWMECGTNFNQTAYFDGLKQLVAYAETKGIVVFIPVHDGWPKTCFDGHPFKHALGNGPLADRRQYVELADYDREMPEAFDPAWDWKQQNQYFQERLCAKLMAELEQFSNVLYELFNEGEWYDKEQRRRHEQYFLAFFRARCSNLLLSNSDHITRDDPHREANLDVVTMHPKDWVGHFLKFAAGFNTAPPKPYLYSEPVPEFDGDTPSLEVVRRSAWETALAGAGWVNQNDPSFGWDPRTAIASKAAARDRAYDYAGHFVVNKSRF